MIAREHADMCKDYAKDLDKELNKQSVFSKVLDNHARIVYVYCHPKDAERALLSDFEYPHREL